MPTAAMASRPESSETDENAPGRSAGLRVLLVDDNDDTRDLLRFVLAQDGYVITDVRDAEAALEHLRKGGYRLVVTDYDLPGKTGAQLLRQASLERLLAFYEADLGSAGAHVARQRARQHQDVDARLLGIEALGEHAAGEVGGEELVAEGRAHGFEPAPRGLEDLARGLDAQLPVCEHGAPTLGRSPPAVKRAAVDRPRARASTPRAV